MKKTPLLLLTFLGGCMMGPNYTPPENSVSDEWKSSGEVSTEDPITEWWKLFEDPLLNRYIEMAAVYNKEVLIAEANILQARAMRQVSASALFPQGDADFNATKTYFSKNGPLFAIGNGAGSTTGSTSLNTGLPFQVQIPQIQNLFNALFDASWEIDLFGKTRRGVEAAEAYIGSAIEQKNDTLLSVMAEVARNYVEFRSHQRQAEITKENIDLLEQNVAIVKKRLECGYVGLLSLENTERDLANIRSTLPDTNAQIYRGIYTLSILTGNLPETLFDELLPQQPLPKVPPAIAVGLRSDLLRRRPDVRLAERNLAVATANIGVAVASFFPTITLVPDGGFQSLSIKNLFQAASRTWALGGDFNLPLFQGGNLVGNLRATRAAASAAALVYQQTVLKALQDAESNLISYTEALATSKALSEATERDKKIVQITQERFTQGLIGMIELLDSKRELNNAEESLLSSDTRALVDLIALYKALGGGWEVGRREGE